MAVPVLKQLSSAQKNTLFAFAAVIHPSSFSSPSPTDISPIAAIASKHSAMLDVAMCQLQDRLWETRRLHDTPDLDGAFVLDEFPDCAEEVGGELFSY